MIFLLALLSTAQIQPEQTSASAFLDLLSEAQRAKTVFPFASELRFEWAYVPKERKGIALRDLNPAQRERLSASLRSLLSEEGMKAIENIRVLEGVLREAEGAHRDPDYYLATVFGSPSDREPWGLRYEGHHLSLNFTFLNGKLISTTPQFFGANPATVLSGVHKGLRILGKQEDLAFDLMRSLGRKQRALALVNETAPADIATSSLRTAAIQADSGIPYTELNEPQRKLLRRLVEAHAVVQKKSRADEIKKEGWDHLVFAWMGATEPGKAHYYRVQSRSYLIESDNTQNNANHIHAVWRSFKGDFGEDMLTEHYAHHQH